MIPLYDRIIVKKEPSETVTAGGIVLPGAAAEKPSIGEIIAVGCGKELPDGSIRPMQVSVGDRILFLKTAGTDIEIDGNKVTQMLEDDVLAVLA